MKTDIQIAREIEMSHISDISKHIGIDENELIPFGKHIAKVPAKLIDKDAIQNKHLILVTAITPTRAGIGKTTTSIGLALGLEKLGKKSVVALREPSLGVSFGMKGGAAGGGYAQVLPMEDINLHFTGDFHAITSAHNMISALLDNYQHQHRGTDKQIKEILWRRVLDVNDRNLRNVVTGMGGNANGVLSESGFDITPASEIMAILCLAENIDDLRNKIDNILLGYTQENQAFYVKDLEIGGAITVLLKDAIHPNLVQTTEQSAAFVHGGPFANIAHGCNSVIATKMAMTYGDYIITEAGFGADLGAEKFFNIKCRKAGISPKQTIIVATSQALKMHGDVPLESISFPNMEGLKRGLLNLEKHIENMKGFGQSVIVAFNQYQFDTEEEMAYIREWCAQREVKFAINNSFSKGGEGAIELAEAVIDAIENNPSKPLELTYTDEDSVKEKIEKIAKNIYGANLVKFDARAELMIRRINRFGMNNMPVCIAKTQYSFSEKPTAYGVAKDFNLHIRDIIINSGAGFIVAVAGSIMRMPGLPKVPQAMHIDIKDGNIDGLS